MGGSRSEPAVVTHVDPARVADYYPLAAERLAAIDETELHGGAGSAQLLATLAVDEAVRCGSRERATRRARQALAMGVLQDEAAIGCCHAVNALFMAGEADEACAAYEQAVRRAAARPRKVVQTPRPGRTGRAASRPANFPLAVAPMTRHERWPAPQ
jgi:hypothetical protein